MKKYIDALMEEMREKFNEQFKEQDPPDEYSKGFMFAYNFLEKASAADVVEVVRCGNCKFSDRRQCGIDTVLTCENEEAPWGMSDMAVFVEGNDFCKYGAKMDEEG